MATYNLGTKVRVSVLFSDAQTGEALDPDNVSLNVKSPDSALYTLVFGTDPEIVNAHPDDEDAATTGRYYADLSADEDGQWAVYWFATGDGESADEKTFTIRPAIAV